jgi:glycine cleavage system H protein
MNIPSELKYTENDEWIRVEDQTAYIGITDFAQSQLSDIVYVEITVDIGADINSGDSCATIESVKAAADVYCPLSGKVLLTNEHLSDTPDKVNSDPYGEAWLIKIELNDPTEIKKLLNSNDYMTRIKDKE